MAECDCGFCATPPRTCLPVPVLFVPPDPKDAFCVWLVRTAPTPSVCVKLDDGRTSYPRSFRSLFDACSFVCRALHVSLPSEQVRALSESGVVKAADSSHVPLREVAFSSPRNAVLPVHAGQSARCLRFRVSRSTVMRPPKKKQCYLPRTVPSSPTRRRASSSSSAESAPAYDPASLGGTDEAEVRAVLADNPRWNPDVVGELIYWDAWPPLHATHGVVEYTNHKKVTCTFVAPDGSLVRNVLLPVNIVKMQYPGQTSHLVA